MVAESPDVRDNEAVIECWGSRHPKSIVTANEAGPPLALNNKFNNAPKFTSIQDSSRRVTQADLNYEGSITIDQDLLDEARMVPFEVVDVLNVTNGSRLTTYVIPGVRGSGKICINGAAARLVNVNDVVIIVCYGQFEEVEVAGHSAQIILVDENNKIVKSVAKNADNLKPG